MGKGRCEVKGILSRDLGSSKIPVERSPLPIRPPDKQGKPYRVRSETSFS